MLARKAFTDAFEGRELVQARFNRNLVYVVLISGEDKSIAKMQVVWTPGGRCGNGTIYENVDDASVLSFDESLF